MINPSASFSIEVDETKARCPVGERCANENSVERKIPVISCEGTCIRGEIARLAANLVAEEEPYRRACHGEVFFVPDSSMAHWVKDAERVVLIDGCFIRCHGRVLANLIEEGELIEFDGLSHYSKYSDLFHIDSVPQAEREEIAPSVADWVLDGLASRT